MKQKCKKCGSDDYHGKGLCKSCYSKWFKENNPEIIKKYISKEYHHDRSKKLEYGKKYSEIHGWNPENKQERVEKHRIRAMTRYYFPLRKGQKCDFCTEMAVQVHHTTKPIRYDEFLYLCNKCHHDEHHPSKDGFLLLGVKSKNSLKRKANNV